MPGADPKARAVMEVPGLRVTAASPELLLGMKLLAARPGQDREDIARLAGLLDLHSARDVLAVAERLHPPDRLQPRTRFLVEEMSPGQSPQNADDGATPPDGARRDAGIVQDGALGGGPPTEPAT